MQRRNETLALLREGDFTLVRQSKHSIWRCPCGHAQVTTHTSRCEGRGDNNAQAKIRRTIRECKALAENRSKAE